MAGSSFLPPAIFEIKAIADQAIAKFGEINKELEKLVEGAAEVQERILEMVDQMRVDLLEISNKNTAIAV